MEAIEQFIDREQEMEILNAEYEREGASFVILYGRRRIGKTTLLAEFIRDKKALFFLASEESENQNRIAFQDKAADFIGSELLREAASVSWDTIFKAITDSHFDSKPVIVIDEFQYIGKSNPAFPSILQRIWEENLKNKRIMLILCGSLISMMVSQTLAYDSPLYGRRTAQIRLKQIPFRHYHKFFPAMSLHDLVEAYAVTGGVPKYIHSFLACGNIYQSIQEQVLNPSAYLYEEPYFLLQQEVSEVGSYFSIIKAIAAGNHKLSAIAALLELPATGLTKYLKTLIDLDILERQVPVTEEQPEKSKKGLYRIKDNYMRFWFTFIYPNRSLIESGNSQIVMDTIRKGFTKNHSAFVYEDVCREKMWELNAEDAWPFHFSKIGRYWDNKEEIDIAAIDPEGNNLILGECKFRKNPVGSSVLQELERKAGSVAWRREKRKTWYILFSIRGFTAELEDIAKMREDLILAQG